MAEASLPIKPEELITIIKRRWWFIVIPFCLVMIAGTFLAENLPRVYQTSTLIQIQPPKVPTNYVQPLVQISVEDRINTLSQQILSRTNLERIINHFKLFQGPDSASMLLEQKVEKLREQIEVIPIRQRRQRGTATESFTITVKGTDPVLITEVTNGLAATFIDENLKDREFQAVGTSQFLDSELKTMRLRLEEVEAVLQNYRKAHMGELPEQLSSNLTILEGLQTSLTEKRQELRDTRNELTALRSNPPLPTTIQIVRESDNQQNDNTLDANDPAILRERLSVLLSRYTEKHPDIIKLKATIAQLEAASATERNSNLQNSSQTAASTPISRVSPGETNLLLEIDSLEREISDIQNQIGVYQRRVENTPRVEQELLSFKRDYDNIQDTYNSLLERKLESDIAVNMEKKQKGEQFRIIDAAKVPVRPVSPNMQRLFFLIVAIGLGMGGGLAFLLEMLDSKIRKAEDVEGFIGLPVLGVMPPILNTAEIFKKRIRILLSTGSLMLSLVLFTIFAISSQYGLARAIEHIKEVMV